MKLIPNLYGQPQNTSKSRDDSVKERPNFAFDAGGSRRLSVRPGQVKTGIVYDTSADPPQPDSTRHLTPSKQRLLRETSQSGRVISTDHEFYNTIEYQSELQRSARAMARTRSDKMVSNGMGAREVFGMENKQYVIDMSRMAAAERERQPIQTQ